jgi:predicted amino acid-binding ACT domain protein
MHDNTRFLVTTALPDRVGILRDVTGALYALGANFTDLRQTVVGGIFTLSAIAEFEAPADPAALAAAVRAALPEQDACVDVRPCAAPASHVAMRIERTSAPRPSGERYVVSVTGPDSPGRIHRIAKVFAAHGANVEDWRHDLSDPARTLTIGVVTIPASADLAALRAALDAELAPLGLSTSLLHENIFRATNEVGPISALLGGETAISRNSQLR